MEKMEQVVPTARTKDIVTRDMPDEVLVYDLKNHKAHCLNQTAAAVWKYCNGQATVTEIKRQMKTDLDLTIDEATVWLAVERLSKANLLEVQITVPIGSSRQSRRETIRRLGMGFAVSVPLVMSIVAPTAIAGASTCATTCRNTAPSTPSQTGSAANCGVCADVIGRCYADRDCTGANASATCVQCVSSFVTGPGAATAGTVRSWSAS